MELCLTLSSGPSSTRKIQPLQGRSFPLAHTLRRRLIRFRPQIAEDLNFRALAGHPGLMICQK